MKTVWKFQIMGPQGHQVATQPLPRGARVIHIAAQYGAVMLWAEIDPDVPSEERRFVVVGTGHPVPEGAEHVGSCIDPPFVWHVYEEVA